MKLTIDRNALMRALSHVQAVVERRNTIPILSNILLQADGDRLNLTATDLDIEASDAAEAKVKKAGQVTAPAQTLFDVVRKLPDGSEIALELTDNRLSIVAGRSRFALPTLPAADFQTMAREDAPVKFEVAAAELRRIIDKTRFAISTEETRYYLNGIYLHHAKGADGFVLRAVATDGHRLALAEAPAPAGSANLKGVIVPRKAVAEARRLLDDAPEMVTVEASDAKITFRIGHATLTSKLIDGSFPDYQRVIPKENGRILTVNNSDFKNAVDRVATVSAERSRSVKLSLSQGKLTLTVSHSETGQGVEELEADYDAEPMEIGFNAKYLLDVTQQIEGEDARIEFNDPASPARVLDGKDAGAQYVLMPLRV
ncbi:MAG: DNA polymerase III subunit beta [Alphaproteobacteria bacterium]|nr:DNA polymerase III subunit beta [Alphaproteobacteria bacterium]